MDITWHGNTCFTLKGKTVTVVTNPDKSIKTALKGEIVLSSLGEDAELAEVKDSKKAFDWPGEYEVAEVPIIGLKAWTRSKSKEEEDGQKAGEGTIIFFFDLEGVKVCHLGGLGHKLTTEMIDEIGDIDVLLVPVGDDSNLKGKTEEIIGQIDPRMVVLMGNSNPGAHSKEAGASKLEEETDKLTVSASGTPLEEKTLYYALKKV
jgi:L-ascorbate metabolism protein UlaG (beta-lactamase superfamily)